MTEKFPPHNHPLRQKHTEHTSSIDEILAILMDVPQYVYSMLRLSQFFHCELFYKTSLLEKQELLLQLEA